MTLDELAELRAAHEAATKGEWEAHSGYPSSFVTKGGTSAAPVAMCNDLADSDFIALAHNRMPELLRLASEALNAKGTP